MQRPPVLSIVVNFYNMRREAPRTLHTLSRAYQRGISQFPYEVIAIDNGSTEPLSAQLVAGFGEHFRYHFHETPSSSPVGAVNLGVSMARGRDVMVMIDGAHLLSPGVLLYAGMVLQLTANPFVATVPFHLGPGPQNRTSREGYDQAAEDALLAKVDWRRDGYELFRLVGSTADASLGWFGCLFESNCFALRRETFEALGGLNPGFTSPGGGMVNLHFFRQALEVAKTDYALLLGEGTFHQFHGGVSTGPGADEQMHRRNLDEYLRVRGKPYAQPLRRPFYVGGISRQCLPAVRRSADRGLDFWEKNRI